MTPFLRLLAVVLLALAVGAWVGYRAALSYAAPGHHRQMAPPLPADLAFYEPPTTSPTVPVVEAVPATGHGVTSRPGETAVRAPSGQAGEPLTGYATWWATFGDGDYAAAGPDLRAALGPDWQGRRVRVCAAVCVTATLTTSCWCVDRRGLPTLADLSLSLFRILDPRGGNGTTDPGYIAVVVRP